MFGLESPKKKKSSDEFIFDLEKDLKTPAERISIKKKIKSVFNK